MSDNNTEKSKEDLNDLKEGEEPKEGEEQEPLKELQSWDDPSVDLKIKLLRGIYAFGFEQPSIIQKKAIIPFLEGKDLIAQAQSGTGKTGAFAISSLQLVNEKLNKTQCLILAPTRPLAKQICNVLTQIAQLLKTRIQLLIGGTKTENDIEKLINNVPHIVVGCPGRIHDMIRRKHLKTKGINLLVIDEADEMFSSGFKEQVYKIFQYMNNDIQICLFSATFPSELHHLANKFMRDPLKILVERNQLTLKGIAQFYIGLKDDEQKYMTLKDLFSGLAITQVIIYCNSINRVENLYDAMKRDEFPVERMHGSMDEEERTRVYNQFKSGGCRVLLSTDLLARGIDIQQVSIVINFDLPKSIHTYLHRIGRSGRWGRKGVGINFITKRDVQKLEEIKRFYSTDVNEMPSDYSTFL